MKSFLLCVSGIVYDVRLTENSGNIANVEPWDKLKEMDQFWSYDGPVCLHEKFGPDPDTFGEPSILEIFASILSEKIAFFTKKLFLPELNESGISG